MNAATPKLTIVCPFRLRYYDVVNLYQHAVVAGTACVGENWELIFAPAGADKSTRAAIDTLIERDNRVNVRHFKRGASPVEMWEDAVEAARGDYIFVVGSASAPIARLPEIMQFASGDMDCVNVRITAPAEAGFGKLLGFHLAQAGRALKGEKAAL